MVNIKHVQLGVKNVEYFNYDGDSLPYRPLCSWELDDAFVKSLEGRNPRTIELVIKVKSGNVKINDFMNINSEEYVDLQQRSNDFDYWVVFHAIKDFQDPDFLEPDEDYDVPGGLRIIQEKFKYVHEIASQVLASTRAPQEVIKELVESPEGKLLASIHYVLHVPLVSEMWKATPLQLKFLELSIPRVSPETPSPPSNKKVIKTGMTLRELYEVIGDARGDQKRP